jgi:ribosome assembly protein YihI (activator of Der GTPase)
MLRFEQAMEAAVRAVSHAPQVPGPNDPQYDPELVALRQLHQMNRENLKHAELVRYTADRAVMSARKAVAETKVRIELLEERLGIEPEEDEE